MDTQCTTTTNPEYTFSLSSGALGSGSGDGVISGEGEQEAEEDEEEQPSGDRRTPVGSISTPAQNSPTAVMAQTPNSALAHWTNSTEGEILRRCEEVLDECKNLQREPNHFFSVKDCIIEMYHLPTTL